jgi:hypothetical protein
MQLGRAGGHPRTHHRLLLSCTQASVAEFRRQTLALDVPSERALDASGDARFRRGTVLLHALAFERASRPNPANLAVNLVLRASVEQGSGPEGLAGADRSAGPVFRNVL